MPKIPQDDKKIIVTNGINSVEGVLSYVKNVDLSERGVIKLSPPMLKIFSNEVAEGGDTDLDLPIEIFAYSEGLFKIITAGEAFNFNIGVLNFSQDSGNADWSDETRVINWVGGDWHIGGFSVKTYTGASGDSVYTQVIGAALSYIELFTNKNALVGNVADNILRQYDTSYTQGQALTIPANFVITGTAYSNNMMGIITRQKKNQGNAYFFVWDGATGGANDGKPVNDSYIIGLVAYQSSWALMTSAGQLLYYNGGGFTELGTLPPFRFEEDYISLGPNGSIDLGNLMQADGDYIYAHCASLPEFSPTNKPYRPGFSAGLYCFDPNVGFYHRGAMSYSHYTKENPTVASDILTLSARHFLKTGDEVWVKTAGLGLTARRVYYAIVISETTLKLADSYDDALASTNVTLSNGSFNDFYFAKRKDYGVESYALRNLGFAKKDRGYDGYDESGVQPTFLGGEIRPNNVAASLVTVVCAFVPMLHNIGYVITSRFNSQVLTDMWKGVGVKHRRLSKQSSILVKTKTVDEDALIIGDMTLNDSSYVGPSVTWDANGKQFETSTDLTGVHEDDEVHIFVGAGAGQAGHIESIEEVVSGTWRVILKEELRGIVASAKSCVSIEKWKYLGTINYENQNETGVSTFPLGDPSTQVEVKLEMRGIGVAITEIKPFKDTFEEEL